MPATGQPLAAERWLRRRHGPGTPLPSSGVGVRRPEPAQRQRWDLQRAAEGSVAAAVHFRQSAEWLQAGDLARSQAERRLAQDLLKAWLPVRPGPAVPTLRPGWPVRCQAALRELACYLRILVPLALVLGLLVCSVLSRG